jgi:drug/metabolite transporter (DMT)-like permease
MSASPAEKSRGSAALFSQLALLNLLWAPVNLMVRWAQAAGFSAAGIGLVRWIGVAIGMFALLALPSFRRLVKARWPTKREALAAALVGVAFMGPAHLLYYATLAHVPTVEGAVLNTTAPFWVALLSGFVLREHVTPRTWVAIGLGAVGTYIVSVGFALPNLADRSHDAGSSLLYLLGIVLESLGGVFAVYLVRRASGATVFAFETIGTSTAVMLAPLVMPATLGLAVPHIGAGWLPLAYLIAISGIFAFCAWNVLAERSPLSLMVVSIAIQPPLAAVLGYFFLREPLTTPMVVGAAFVFCGLVIAATGPEAAN